MFSCAIFHALAVYGIPLEYEKLITPTFQTEQKEISAVFFSHLYFNFI
jgi:hypothetical protein